MRISDWSSDVCSSDLDGLHAPANQVLGFRGSDDGVEVPIFRFTDRPGQRRDAARQERIAILAGDVLRTAEVADAAGDQLVLLDRSQFGPVERSEEHTSELQSLMRNSSAVSCLKKKKNT